MNTMIKYSLWGVPFLTLYVFLSSLISTTEWIWYLTRVFGLVSFFFLFLTIIIGELRLLYVVKGDFKLFKYHVPISIFTIFLVVLHFIAALFDKFKWGVNLHFKDFLGFSFSDKWLTLLSLGTLGFYLLVLIGMTSMKRSIRKIGFKNWKLVHLLSYVSFCFAFIHTINLGTDVKTSFLSPVFKPLIMFLFWFIMALLVVRFLKSHNVFVDQTEIVLASVFFIILIVGGIFASTVFFSAIGELPTQTIDSINDISAEISYYEQANSIIIEQNSLLTNEINNIRGNTT